MFQEHTKHVELDYHFILERVKNLTVNTYYVTLKDQLANLLTKALSQHQHESLLRHYNVKNVLRRKGKK